MTRKSLRKMTTILYLVVFIYIVGGLFLYRYQRRFIFRPEKLPAGYRFDFPVPFREFNLPLNDTDLLNVVWLEAKESRGVVLYFHGNMGNIVGAAAHAGPFLDNHYDVLLVDYPGYGKSTGPREEQDLYNDALVSYQLARSRYPADSIVVYGKSLGTALAAYVASKEPCRDLVLECPFYDYTRLVRHYVPIYPVSWLLRYQFPVYDYVRHTTAPVLIFHGKKDEVIPYRNAVRLKSVLKTGDRFIPFLSGHHNDLARQPGYREVMDSVLSPRKDG